MDIAPAPTGGELPDRRRTQARESAHQGEVRPTTRGDQPGGEVRPTTKGRTISPRQGAAGVPERAPSSLRAVAAARRLARRVRVSFESG